MNRQLILTTFVLAILGVFTFFQNAIIPPHWLGKILHVVQVPVLIFAFVYFLIMYARIKLHKNKDNTNKPKLLTIIGVCILVFSIIIGLIVPQIYPNMDAIESKIWMYSVIVGVCLAVILITFSLTLERNNKI